MKRDVLSKFIAVTREKSKLSLRDLAEKCKLSHQTVLRVERVLAKPRTAKRVFEYLFPNEKVRSTILNNYSRVWLSDRVEA